MKSKIKQIFENVKSNELEEIEKRNEAIKEVFKPYFNGLYEIEAKITIQNIEQLLRKNLKVVI